MKQIEYLHIRIEDSITGNIIGIIPCAQCKRNENECPVYKDAIKYNGLLHINTWHNKWGNKIVSIGFPESYGEVLRNQEYKRWLELATHCKNK